MPDTPAFLVDRLTAEGVKTTDFFKALTEEQWETEIYTDGSCWSVHQVLAHFVSTESAIGRLIENILAGGIGVSEDFDIDAYNERKVASIWDVPADSLIVQFTEFRTKNVGLVANMTQDDLARRGRHPFLGVTEIAEIIKLLYRHNQIHQRDIRKKIS